VKKSVNLLRFARVMTMTSWPHFWPTLYIMERASEEGNKSVVSVRLLVVSTISHEPTNFHLAFLHLRAGHDHSLSRIEN